MFLEAQFGADNLTPIAIPRTSSVTEASLLNTDIKPSPELKTETSDTASELETPTDTLIQEKEIARLQKLGIPVPGIEIKVDKMVAKVWLEDLEVESANRVFGERVRAVVERAVEVTAPLWG